MRHGQAQAGEGGPDFTRRLTPRGRRQAMDAGRSLAAAGLVPDLVIVSGATRAQETWARVAEGLSLGLPRGGAEAAASDAATQVSGAPVSAESAAGGTASDADAAPGFRVVVSDALYSGYVRELVGVLGEAVGGADPGIVLVVAHNPTVSAAASRLSGLGSAPDALARAEAGLPTSSYAVLRLGAIGWAEVGHLPLHLAEVVTPAA
jgi:phosphohistidine phosphatase